MSKEYIEIFGGGRSAQIHDFKEVSLYSGDTGNRTLKLGVQDKGQKAMIAAWLEALKTGRDCISYDCLMTTSLATVMAVESMTLGAPLQVDLSVFDEQN
jgi:polar amino acid transport system substrate-binding protein